MTTVLITGANRGIGLALAQQYAQQGAQVFAVCRESSEALEACENVTIVSGIDVTDAACLANLSERMSGIAIDILINNAGLLRRTELSQIEEELELYRAQFEVNTLAPLRVTQALRSHLGEGAKVVIITSRMGSMADNDSGGQYAYRISKAGINSAGKSLAIDLAPAGISLALLHPGYVKTGMTRYTGHVEAEQSAEQLRQRIEEMSLETTGCFRHANGEVLPW